MCTLTWLRDASGYRIYFNRDEKRTRLPARPPAVRMIDGVPVLTPTDGDAGGSWMAVNAFGLTLAILNFYEADAALPAAAGPHESRGHLVLNLSPARDLAALARHLDRTEASRYRPFLLAAFGVDGAGLLFRWDGRALERQSLADTRLPVTTSSFRTADVLAARRRKFESFVASFGGVTDDMLRAFHHSRDEQGGAFSVTMTRPDAQTVSFSMVTIGPERIIYYYQSRHMGEQDPAYATGEAVVMERA